MKRNPIVLICALVFLLAVGAAAQQKDNQDCKDHPAFTRMPTYWIHSCKNSQFDAFEFKISTKGKEHVEGQMWKINYYPQASATQKPSELQIQRNFENAVKQQGGTVVFSEKGRSTLKLTKDGKEIWAEVTTEFTGKYTLIIVQKEEMVQDIVADAAFLANGLKTTGHVTVEGIYFDTGLSTIKPESAQAIGEIAKMLTADSALKLYVVGHTDNVGGVESNLKLSQDRAEAVLQSLVKDHGIAAARLRAFGCAMFASVASNDNEEGRAKNRRVELVKQ
jgi:OmpA-OmpF porin, OOP family